MAELVGDAYIRITADTDVMRKALGRQMKAAGKDDAGNYIRSFSNEVKANADREMKGAQKSLAKGLADPKEFDKMAKSFDSVEQAAESWRKKLRELSRQHKIATGDYKEFKKAIDNWETSAVSARKAAKELNDAHFEAIVENKRIIASQKAATKAVEDDMKRRLKAWKEMERAQAHAIAAQKAAEKAELDGRLARFKDLQRVAAYTLKADKAEERAKQKAVAAAERIRVAEEKLAAARKKAGNDEVGRLGKLSRSLAKLNIGKFFGKGSRNDFINIVGSMIGGLGKLVTVPLSLLAKAGDSIFSTFSEGYNTAKAAGSGFFKSSIAGFGSLATVVAEAAAAWPLLLGGLALAIAGFGALAAILPSIVSLVGLLATALVSLTSAISFGLIGALLAVAPAALGALAGLGGVFAVIQDFVADKKNKKFMTDFGKPFADFNKSHWPEVKTFLTNIKSGFGTLFADINPAVTAFFTSWKTAMNDPSTKKGLGNFSDSIGRMATTLNTALPKALSGLIGFFQPILPYAEKLTNAIADAFSTFDRWANSPKGQNQIADFMKRAWEAANDVWDILTDIGSIIGTVFDFGESSGDSFLKGIHGWLQKIDDYLNNPANKGAIDEWFANAKQIGDDVGKIATGIGDAIVALSSSEGQGGAKVFMDNVATLAQNLRDITDLIVNLGKISTAPFAVIGKLLGVASETAPPPPPKQVQDNAQQRASKAAKAGLGNFMVTLDVDDKMYRQKIAAIEMYQITGKTIPIEGNEALWNSLKDTVAAYIFTPKEVPIEGEDTAWQENKAATEGYVFNAKQVPVEGADGPWLTTRKSVSGYVFDGKQVKVHGNDGPWVTTRKEVSGYAFAPKTVNINADASDVRGAVASAKRYLASLPAVKRIRIAGVNSVGGITTAAGGVFDGAQHRIIGEAGPEAVVPLNRPLSMVDPSVRAISAFAQGLSVPSSGQQQGPRVNFSEGAIQVNLPTGDPKLAAEAVLDRLVAFIG